MSLFIRNLQYSFYAFAAFIFLYRLGYEIKDTPYIGAYIAAVVALSGIIINVRLQLKNTRKDWINRLNDHFSEFFATLSDRRKKDFEFYKHRASLELLLDESKPIRNS